MIPVIGESFKIKVNWATVVIECQCDAKTILVLMQPNVLTKCAACGKSYALLDELNVRVAQAMDRASGLALMQ